VCACLAGAGAAGAQPVQGALTGTVTGDSGSPLAGVVVTVQHEGPGRREVATTDADGRYAFPSLPADGEYQVSVAIAGFASAASERVLLVPSATSVVDFRLRLSVRESVAVSAPTPLIERGPSNVHQTVSEQLTHALPLAGRNFIPLAMLTAGFTGNPNYPSAQGQSYWTNNVLVDGASHFSKWRSAARTFYSGYGLESIREVRVLSNRFSAEYGDSLATVTTAITRSGTDELRGTALFFAQDDALDTAPVFALTKPPSGAERYGFSLGGPFTPQRTHFFESYEGRRARNHNVVVSPNPAVARSFVPDDEDEHLLFFRVDHRRTSDDLYAVRYNGQWFRWHDEPGGLTLPGSGTHYRNDVHTVLVTNRRIWPGGAHNEARVQFARYTDVRTDLDPGVFVSRAGYSQEGGTLGAPGYGADPEDTWEGADTFSRSIGSHALRIGGGLKYVRAHNAFLNYGRGAYFFAGAPDVYRQPYLFMQGVAPTPDRAFADPRAMAGFGFVQDDWRIRRGLTISLGTRYDVERIAHVRNYTAGADLNNVQPRVGVAWEPWPAGRWLLRGGAGVYTQQHLLLYINRVQLEGPDGAVTVALAPDSPLFPRYPGTLTAFPAGVALPPRDIQRVDPAFRNPYSIQATAGVEHLVGRTTISADYVMLDGRDLMSLADANAPASIVKPANRTVAQADLTRPLVPAPGSFRNIVVLGNEGRSWYRALQVKVERSSGPLQTVASYTLAHADDMASYQLPEDSRNIQAEKARANTDIRHNVSVGFSWQLPGERPLLRGWSLSGVGAFHSNRPYTITWGDDRNGTTQNDARPGGRNTERTDAYRDLDLAIGKRFTWRATTIEGRVESFNLFDAINYDQYVGSLQSPLFAQPISAFPSRRVQLAAVVRF
jgi:hypothetical protein